MTRRRRKNAGWTRPSQLTYADFHRTGEQDCGNTFSINDYDLEKYDDPREAVDNAELMAEEDWLEQNDDFDDLDPTLAYQAWLDGYKSCARVAVEDAIERRRARDRELHETFWLAHWHGDSDDVEIVESLDTLSDALDMLARMDMGVIYKGDADGPDYRIVYTISDFGSDEDDFDYLFWEDDDLNVTPDTKWKIRNYLFARSRVEERHDLSSKELAIKHYKSVRAELRRRGHKFSADEYPKKNAARKRATR